MMPSLPSQYKAKLGSLPVALVYELAHHLKPITVSSLDVDFISRGEAPKGSWSLDNADWPELECQQTAGQRSALHNLIFNDVGTFRARLISKLSILQYCFIYACDGTRKWTVSCMKGPLIISNSSRHVRPSISLSIYFKCSGYLLFANSLNWR